MVQAQPRASPTPEQQAEEVQLEEIEHPGVGYVEEGAQIDVVWSIF